MRETARKIRALLAGTVPANRAIPASLALIDRTSLSRGETDMPEEVARSFVFRVAPNKKYGKGDWITGIGMRMNAIEVDLSIFMGGGEGTTSDYASVEEEMTDLVDAAIQVIEDPNNQDRTVTGWIDARDFTNTKPVPKNGRLESTLKFDVVYEQDYGTL